MNTTEAAQALSKTPYWVRRQCHAKELRASRFGGSWLITPEAVAEYIDAHSNTPQPVKVRQRPRRT